MLELIRKILSMFLPKKISLAHYPIRMDYGTMNAQQRNAFDCILDACEANAETAEIPVLTQVEFDEVVAHIGLHFGNADICKNIAHLRSKRKNGEWWYYATVNLDLYKQAKAHKAELDALVDDALRSMNEGTTEYKLKQVAKYIANHAEYECPSNNPLDLLDKGAMCGAYSMLFYKMATRLGIQAYICFGFAKNSANQTGFHAWNMADGHFYDVTFYDGNRNPKYIHSATPWGREYTVNTR